MNTFFLCSLVFLILFIVGKSITPQSKYRKWGVNVKNEIKVKLRKIEGADENIYIINELQQRKVLPRKIKKNITKYLILSGASNTFGQNLKLKDTLSNQIQSDPRFNSFQAYNLSYPGWGANDVLDYVTSKEFEKNIQEKSGIFIYYFSNFQIKRVCGSHHFWDWSHGLAPNYVLDNETLRRDGLQKDTLNFKYYLLEKGLKFFIPSSFFLKTKKSIKSNLINDRKCTNLVVSIFMKLKEELSKKLPNLKFVVSLIPEFSFQNKLTKSERIFYSMLIGDSSSLVLTDTIKFKELFDAGGKEIFFSDYHVNSYGISLRKEVLYYELVRNHLL
jgi:hypothetical protein